MTTLPDRPPGQEQPTDQRATRNELFALLATCDAYLYTIDFTRTSEDLCIYTGVSSDAAAAWAELLQLPEAAPDAPAPHEVTETGSWVRNWYSRGEWRGWTVCVWHLRYETAPVPADATTVVMEQLDAELAEHQEERESDERYALTSTGEAAVGGAA